MTFCHSERSRGISDYFRFRKHGRPEIFRDVSTSVDMTRGSVLENKHRCNAFNMKTLIALFLFLSAITAHAEKISLVGATVINPADGKVTPNATIVINGDKIERVSMGKQEA